MSTVDPSDANSATTDSFLTALVFNLVVAGIEIAIFTLIRRQFPAIYEPRTFAPVEERRRQPPLSHKLFTWPYVVFMADPKTVLEKNGSVDAYTYLMYLRLMLKIIIPIWILSWIILLPVDAAGTGVAGKQKLDRFTFGNVSSRDQPRLGAHLALAYIFTFWTFWCIRGEMKEWLTLRQRHLVSDEHSKLPQARTVLFTGVPKKYLDEAKLAQLFSHLPGGAKFVWLNRDLKEMPDLYNDRLKAVKKLESAETDLIKTATKLKLKEEKAAAKKNGKPVDDKWNSVSIAEGDVSLAERLVPKKKRPSHRLPPFKWLPFSLPFMGKKVDTIEWCRETIREKGVELHASREQLRKDIAAPGTGDDEVYPPLNSAFVLFNQQIAAHMALQSVMHNQPYAMSGRYIEMAPGDVIWSNLGLNPYEQQIRRAISYAATAGLIFLWAFPVAFVGLLSNVTSLSQQFTWLRWLGNLPSIVTGLISGVLPTILLAVLFLLLPIVLRLLARFEGIPKRTGVELSLMTRYTIFLTIHGFLIVTISSGLIKAVPELAQDPTSIPNVLAKNLPSASTFFLSYITLQGIAGSAGNFIQYVALLIYYVKLILLGSTPRSVYNIKYTMRRVSWGTVFPKASLLVIITFGYMIISPIINGLAVLSFGLLYMSWKYQFIWVYDMPPESETGGLFFPKAVSHIFVGMYIQEVCLCALFFLARDENGKTSAIPEGALMVVLIVFTAGFQYTLQDSYKPLKESLPLSLAHRSYGMPHESGHGGSVIDPQEAQRLLDPNNVEPTESRTDERKPLRSSESAPGSKDGFMPGSGAPHSTDGAGSRPPMDGRRPSGMELQDHDGSRHSLDNEDDDAREELQDGVARKDHARRGSADSGHLAGGKKSKEERELEEAFAHPATCAEQQILWLPKDNLGLAEEAVRNLQEYKIHATTRDAQLDAKGKVEISGSPPNDDKDTI